MFFGGSKDSCIPPYAKNFSFSSSPDISFKKLAHQHNLKTIVVLHQTHSANGIIIQSFSQIPACNFEREGDFLITSLRGIALGVVTADCLPILMHDTAHNAVAAIHAGWKGSVQQVALRAYEVLQTIYGTQADNVEIFFGPAAKLCCYQIKDDVERQILALPYGAQSLSYKDTTIFFDTALFNYYQLLSVGIPQSAFKFICKLCTMCDLTFCSYRRDPDADRRNLSFIGLL